MSIGARISSLRKEKNLSQGQLASLMGVTRQAVSKWENDTAAPDVLNLIKLSDILDVELEYLATGKSRNPSVAPVLPDELPQNEVEKAPPSPLPLFLFCILSFLFGILIALIFSKDD